MIPVVTPGEMRAIDAAAPDPVEVLIERAGSAVARAAIDLLGGTYGRTICVVAGPGNNGADGRVAAERLRERGAAVKVYHAVAMPPALAACDLLIDAAFGTGFRDDWKPPTVDAGAVLAVDVPTGLDGLTGQAGPHTLRADRTVTFAAAKPGHVLGDGPAHVGELVIADIGLDVGLEIGSPTTSIVDASDVARWLPRRPRDTHKWRSALRIVAGSVGMTGAAALAAGAAQRTGSGYVTLSSPGIEAHAPIEVVDRRIPPFDWADAVLDDLPRFHALVIGPGLGRAERTIPSIVRTVAESVVPVVVDGDGLFALAWNSSGTPLDTSERAVPTILTPHDGEYAVLVGRRPGRDRIAAARQLVEMTGAIVLLKGPTTVVAAPDGSVRLVVDGDQRLASAGTGDVLSGVIGALLARGVAGPEAAAAGAWIHARAGHRCAPHGLIASDLVETIPGVLGELP